MNQLHSLILQEIQEHGPITVRQFIELALYHPDHGYYASQKVLGKEGDYITAPELTQVFGELLALWFVDLWERLGKPKAVQLVEMGPGRGLMMQDMLRIFKKFPELYQSLHVYLMEVSPVLKKTQHKLLENEHINWITSLKELPQNSVTFFVANEFFDALPIEQYDENGIERRVGVKEGELVLGNDSAIKEKCPFYETYMSEINQRLLKDRGGAIIIDYGDDVVEDNRVGDTLQALCRHKKTDILDNPGEQDLTHHVSFAVLKSFIDPNLKTKISTQSEFLFTLGLEEWVKKLCAKSDRQSAIKLMTAAARLVAPKEMGQMFKVLIIES